MSSFCKLSVACVAIFVLLEGCVDKIQFDIPTARSLIYVEGMISNNPEPYIVKVSEGVNLNSDSVVRAPIQKAHVTLFDDLGNSEDLVEVNPGDYSTGGAIKGQVGHSYYITIETSDGNIFKSDPDLIKSVGEIEEIRYKYEARLKEEKFGIFPADVFNILIDAQNPEGSENYTRWRFTGTYKVLTYPEYNWYWLSGFALWDPDPCSGVKVIPLGERDPNPSPLDFYNGPKLPTPGLEGKLSRFGECTCCNCYVNQFESIPQLSDAQLITNNQFRNVTVAQVPINTETFYDKYYVQIEQMSLTRTAYEFFKLVRAQKEGASSLFQPPSGEIRGNIKAVNNTRPIVGLFWATAIASKSTVIFKSEIPYAIGPIKYYSLPCDQSYENSTTKKPAFWQ